MMLASVPFGMGLLQCLASPKIRETWFNGKAYYRLNDQPLTVVPDLVANRPDPDRLK